MPFPRFVEAQRLSCPSNPDIKNPISVYQSLFKDTTYFEGVDLLRTTIENWKDSLSGANLSVMVVSNSAWITKLREANYSGIATKDSNYSVYFDTV
jgi:hypothetical protein